LDGEESQFHLKAIWYKSLSLFRAGKMQEFAEMEELIPDPHRPAFEELLQSLEMK
jgi:hypothetical protein